jgi:hypothetical protein
LGAHFGHAFKPVAPGQMISRADDAPALPQECGTPASCSRFRPTKQQHLSRFNGDHGGKNNDWGEQCKNFFEFS